jgi:hypothetical protein
LKRCRKQSRRWSSHVRLYSKNDFNSTLLVCIKNRTFLTLKIFSLYIY